MASSVIKKTIASEDVVNNLTSTATDKPLSAAQGKALNDKFMKRFFASSESALTTACSNLAIGEFAVGEIENSVLTLGAAVPVIIYKRTATTYFAAIIYSGYHGYYYSSVWHWNKFSYT